MSSGVEPRNFSYIHYNFRNHHLVNGSLLIRELEEADQGYYLCEAHNGIGAGISKLVFLTVHVPPHFDTKHRSYNVAKVRLAQEVPRQIKELNFIMHSISLQHYSKSVANTTNERVRLIATMYYL